MNKRSKKMFVRQMDAPTEKRVHMSLRYYLIHGVGLEQHGHYLSDVGGPFMTPKLQAHFRAMQASAGLSVKNLLKGFDDVTADLDATLDGLYEVSELFLSLQTSEAQARVLELLRAEIYK